MLTSNFMKILGSTLAIQKASSSEFAFRFTSDVQALRTRGREQGRQLGSLSACSSIAVEVLEGDALQQELQGW